MKKLLSTPVLVLLVAVVFTLASCKDDDKDMLPPHESLLVAHSWKFSDLTYQTTDTVVLSILKSAKSMLQGHKYTFFKDHTLTNSFEPTKGTWQLSSDGKTLKTMEGGFEGTYTVSTLDESSFVMEQHYENFDLVLFYVKD